ncbi:molybdopterin-dependent oxidoreductase [soil metagenome]
MKKLATSWSLAGIIAGIAGLATSFLVAKWMNLRLSPVAAVAELVRDVSPSSSVEWAKETFGTFDKVLLPLVIVLIVLLCFALTGNVGRVDNGFAVLGYVGVTIVGVVGVLHENGAQFSNLTPLAVGLVTMTVSFSVIAAKLRALERVPKAKRFEEPYVSSRRSLLVAAGAVAAIAGLSGVLGKVFGGKRTEVEQERTLNQIEAFTAPSVPAGVRTGVDGTAAWMTPARDFYLIDTAFAKPLIKASEWRLRIHGMVENEIELSYADLLTLQRTEGWVTLNCVSNPVGGDLVGNAWWSGVLLAPIIAMAKPLQGADAILQTSDDGWTCGTPLETVLDGRDSMLALYMNGAPLTIEHGYPVRTLVPGLYGYVSATKWVVDMEITRFDDFDAYWTQRGWGQLGPVKMASRVEVPRSGASVGAGEVTIAGSAWHQHVGISGVEIAVDGGAWTPADLATAVNDDSWVQWRAVADLEPGKHSVKVRAINKAGEVQTGAYADVLPDGATGWDEIGFTVSA